MSQLRKWFTFSIRDVLWLMVVTALAAAWYARERNLEVASDDRLELIKELLRTRSQFAQERISGLQDEKAQLEDTIQELKAEQLKADAHLGHVLSVRKKLEAENKALSARSAAATRSPEGAP
jgi:septal ring factor EnvC (AmiA/AmiB activator)